MKILLLSHKFNPDIGGIESISEMLAEEFVKAGHDVRVLTWSKGITDNKSNFEVIRNPKLGSLIKQFLWSDVVFENNPCIRLAWPNIFIGKTRIVGLQTWITRTDGKKNSINKLKNNYLFLSKKVIACSDAIRQRHWKKAIVIGNPYNHEMFKITTNLTRDKDFVFLGRLVSDKGVDIAIKAISKLQINGQNYSLTIIGEGEELINLKKLTKNLQLENQIIFTGPKRGQELVNCLNEHKYMLVPSVWEEPFGIVALEGMACGCIPIVSDGGGLPDAVGNAGLTFQRSNVDDLVHVIQNVIHNKDLQIELIKAIPEHLKTHTAKEVARKYLQIITESIQ